MKMAGVRKPMKPGKLEGLGTALKLGRTARKLNSKLVNMNTPSRASQGVQVRYRNKAEANEQQNHLISKLIKLKKDNKKDWTKELGLLFEISYAREYIYKGAGLKPVKDAFNILRKQVNSIEKASGMLKLIDTLRVFGNKREARRIFKFGRNNGVFLILMVENPALYKELVDSFL